MPSSASEPARIIELVGKATLFLLFFAADNADSVAKLTAFFCKGVYVET